MRRRIDVTLARGAQPGYFSARLGIQNNQHGRLARNREHPVRLFVQSHRIVSAQVLERPFRYDARFSIDRLDDIASVRNVHENMASGCFYLERFGMSVRFEDAADDFVGGRVNRLPLASLRHTAITSLHWPVTPTQGWLRKTKMKTKHAWRRRFVDAVKANFLDWCV
jgi:hypothetical protein